MSIQQINKPIDFNNSLELDAFLDRELDKWGAGVMVAETFSHYNEEIRQSLTSYAENDEKLISEGIPPVSQNHPKETRDAISSIIPKLGKRPLTAIFIGVQYYDDHKFIEPIREIFQYICKYGGKLYFLDRDEETLKELKKRVTKGQPKRAAVLVETRVVDLTRGLFEATIPLIEKYKANGNRFDLFMKDSLKVLKELSEQPLKDLPEGDLVSSSLVIDQLFALWKKIVLEKWPNRKVKSLEEINAIDLEMDQTMYKIHIQDIMSLSKKWIYLAYSRPFQMKGVNEDRVLLDAKVQRQLVFEPASKPLEKIAFRTFSKSWMYCINSGSFSVHGQIFEKK